MCKDICFEFHILMPIYVNPPILFLKTKDLIRKFMKINVQILSLFNCSIGKCVKFWSVQLPVLKMRVESWKLLHKWSPKKLIKLYFSQLPSWITAKTPLYIFNKKIKDHFNRVLFLFLGTYTLLNTILFLNF